MIIIPGLVYGFFSGSLRKPTYFRNKPIQSEHNNHKDNFVAFPNREEGGNIRQFTYTHPSIVNFEIS